VIGRLLRNWFAANSRAGRVRPASSPAVTTRSDPLLRGGSFLTLARCRHGLMAYNRNDIYIGRSLELYREFSEIETEFLQRLVRPGDILIDAGANIGTHSVALARKAGPGGLVVAYEPQRSAFQLLCANVILNELLNVAARQAAAGAVPGTIKVPMIVADQQQNYGGVALGQWTDGETVPVERIDDLELPRCALIKADVEGMEADVIAGATETIRRHRPYLYVENDRDERSGALIAAIQDLDYRLFWHLPPLFNPENHAGVAENAFGSVISANMFCVPKEQNADMVDGLRAVSGPLDTWRN
jgi:FkbM family methyltransferase